MTMMLMMRRAASLSIPLLSLLLFSIDCTVTTAFLLRPQKGAAAAFPSPSIRHNNNNNNFYPKRSSSLSVFDLTVAETVASAAAIPTVLVGTGSFLLNSEGEEKEEDNNKVTSAAAVLDNTDDDGEVDIYRDTLLRYAGYANEVGEAFAPLVPPIFVPASYGVAITYVLADTIDKTLKCLKSDQYEEKSLNTCAAIEGIDALIWQLAASVALPGYTIHQIVAIVVALLTAAGLYGDGVTSTNMFINALPTAIGLATIPLIVKPLDELAEVGMDVTFRKLFKPYLESCEI